MNGENLIDSNTLPIFFFQEGAHISLFFDKILKQAQLTNGKENIYVLTDSNFHLYKEYNCIDISKYKYGTQDFDKVYQHHSSNKYHFEKACFDRWFIINAIVKELNIAHFFHADCDVLILEDLKPIYSDFLKNNYNGTMMFFENGLGNSITSGHSSFWSNTLIDSFCNFVCNKYGNKEEFSTLLNDALEGKFYDNKNMSDMILLDVFRTETNPGILNLLSLEPQNICFDFNLNASYNGCKYNYVMSPVSKTKKLTRRKDGIYGQTVEDSSLYLKFYTLHFQGYVTKTLIPLYVTFKGQGGYIPNKLSSEWNFGVRKMKLLKNQLRDKFKRIIGN